VPGESVTGYGSERAHRRRELTVRAVLGAARRLRRQLLIEMAGLGGLGGPAGGVVAVAVGTLRASAPHQHTSRPGVARLDHDLGVRPSRYA